MTIRTTHRAGVDYRDTLAAWGDPPLLVGAEVAERLDAVREWAARSRTARHVLAVVDLGERTIDLVGMHGGETVFEALAEDRGVVFWNVDASYRFEQDGPQTLHANVVLLHELGHAVQWRTDPAFFRGEVFPFSQGAERQIRDHARAHYEKQAGRQGISGFAARRAFAENRMQIAGGPPRERPAWSPRIEIDNLYRHEWPICDEAGLPRRRDYASVRMIGTPGGT